MFRKFDAKEIRWEGADPHIYKENADVFRAVTKTVLFDNEGDLPVEFRYFQIEPGGWSSLEHHAHMHMVVIFKGKGHALVGEEVHEVHEGDMFTIPGWAWHQLRADAGERLGFFCLVRHDRDIPSYPDEEEMKALRAHAAVRAFLDGCAD